MKQVIKNAFLCYLLFVVLVQTACSSQGVGADLGQILGQGTLGGATDVDYSEGAVGVNDESLGSNDANSVDSSNSATDVNQSVPGSSESELFDTDPVGTFSLPVNPSKNEDDCAAEEQGDYIVMLVDSSTSRRSRQSTNRYLSANVEQGVSVDQGEDTEVEIEQCQVTLEGDTVWKDVSRQDELANIQVVVAFENGDETILKKSSNGSFVLASEWVGDDEEFLIFVEDKQGRQIVSQNMLYGKAESQNISYESVLYRE